MRRLKTPANAQSIPAGRDVDGMAVVADEIRWTPVVPDRLKSGRSEGSNDLAARKRLIQRLETMAKKTSRAAR